MILEVLFSTASTWARCEAEGPAWREEQCSIKLQKMALQVERSSDVPRNDFVWWRMPSRRRASEANFEMWFDQEKSWLIVRPMSMSDWTSMWSGSRIITPCENYHTPWYMYLYIQYTYKIAGRGDERIWCDTASMAPWKEGRDRTFSEGRTVSFLICFGTFPSITVLIFLCCHCIVVNLIDKYTLTWYVIDTLGRETFSTVCIKGARYPNYTRVFVYPFREISDSWAAAIPWVSERNIT